MAPSTWRSVVALAVALVSVGGAACERSGYQYVRDKPTGTYLKVPEDWKVTEATRTIDLEAQGVTADQFQTRFPMWRTLDAAAPKEPRGFDPARTTPMGFVRVTRLNREERDELSFRTLRDDIFTVNAGIEEGEFVQVGGEEIQTPGARGQRVVFRTPMTVGDPEQGPTTEVTVMIDQTTLVDPKTSKSYVLILACTAACYEEHKKQINIVVDSLTIKET